MNAATRCIDISIGYKYTCVLGILISYKSTHVSLGYTYRYRHRFIIIIISVHFGDVWSGGVFASELPTKKSARRKGAPKATAMASAVAAMTEMCLVACSTVQYTTYDMYAYIYTYIYIYIHIYTTQYNHNNNNNNNNNNDNSSAYSISLIIPVLV